MRDDDRRKILEEENEDTEADGPSDKLGRSGRETNPTKKYTYYKLYVTVAGEDEFVLDTNGDKSNDGDNGNRFNCANDSQMNNEALSVVAHYVIVHMLRRKCSRSKRRDTSPKLGNTHWMMD
jgi:hypothetical protein